MEGTYENTSLFAVNMKPFGEGCLCASFFGIYMMRGLSDLMAHRRNTWLSYFSGVLFSMGWWIYIDASIPSWTSTSFDSLFLTHRDTIEKSWWWKTPAILATLSHLLLVLTPRNLEEVEPFRVRLGLLISFCLMFGSVFGAIWILTLSYSLNIGKKNEDRMEIWYQGIAVCVQTLLIICSALIIRLGLRYNDDEEDTDSFPLHED